MRSGPPEGERQETVERPARAGRLRDLLPQCCCLLADTFSGAGRWRKCHSLLWGALHGRPLWAQPGVSCWGPPRPHRQSPPPAGRYVPTPVMEATSLCHVCLGPVPTQKFPEVVISSGTQGCTRFHGNQWKPGGRMAASVHFAEWWVLCSRVWGLQAIWRPWSGGGAVARP